MNITSPDFTKYSDFYDKASIYDYRPGDYIFHEGDDGDCMYVVLEGKVQITSGRKKLSVLEKGDIFGDMALIDNSSRSANVTAITDCRIASIDAYAFRFLIQKVPDFALDMLMIMANRIRVMNII